jgi:hypothetical protein
VAVRRALARKWFSHCSPVAHWVSEYEEDDMSESLGQAVELLASGDWKKAHEIVQKEKSTVAAWIHGIVHILEGDLDNARGWYKRAERDFPGADAAQAEIAAARRAVASGV